MSRLFLAPLFLALSALSLHATDYYVDPEVGDDHANGLAAKAEGANAPMKTIARAIKAAQPGDTVNLAKATYREVAVFHNRSGEPGKPITLDGHGAMLEGSDPLNPDDWKEVSSGLFKNDNLLRLDDAVIQRWFFLWDGKMNHMGRTSKGLRPDFKKPEDLQPGEWSFIKDPSRTAANSPSQIFGSFYVKLPPGQKIADAHIAAPIRSAGVQISGDDNWITIRNVSAAHVYNDGYNIHGKCRDVVFEHIASFECGDDGISSHDDCRCRIDGFVSVANSTGIADAGDSVTDYDHVYIDGVLGVDLLFIGGHHSIHNAVVLSHAHTVMSVGGQTTDTGTCSLALDNVFIRRDAPPAEARIGKGGSLDLQHVTMLGFHLLAADGEITAHDTVFGLAPEKNGLWGAARGAKAAELLKELTPHP